MLRRLALPALLLACAGCATGVTRVHLRAPDLDARPAESPTAVVRLAVRDARADPARVGVKKNTYGEPVGDALLEGDAALDELFTSHFSDALARHGFRVVEGADGSGVPVLEVVIHRVWAELGPGAFTRRAKAEIELGFEATGAGGEGSWSRMSVGSAEASSLGGPEALLTEVLEAAYARIWLSLEDDLASGELRRVLGAPPLP